MADSVAHDDPAPSPSRRRVWLSRAAAALVVAALVTAAFLARRAGVDAEMLRRELALLGWMAPPVFVLLFAAGELLHLPGILFVAVARIVFGPALGLAIGYTGALFALFVSFAVARQLVAAARATREPWRPRWRFLRSAFERLEARPVRTIALLRLVLWLAPPLTYALASTRIRAREHLMGCAIGLVLPVVAVHCLSGLL